MGIAERLIPLATILAFSAGTAHIAQAQPPGLYQTQRLPVVSFGPPLTGGQAPVAPPGPIPGFAPLPLPEPLAAPPIPALPAEEEVVLPPPSAADQGPAYAFFDPAYWFPTEGWSNSFEIGINGSTGNAESFSLRTGAHLQRQIEAATFTLDLKYAKTLASGQETQHNALLNSNVESSLGDSLWTTFFKTSLEYDEFKAWDVRTAMNAGIGYHVVKTEDARFIVRFGSGVSREVGGPEDEYVPEAVYGVEFDRKITRRQKLYATIDYFPDWTNYSDYRLVTNAGWEFVLDQDANLSLKLGAIDRYDSTPHDRKPNDLDYSLVLLWKQ
jgi:hypothetical protein